MRVLHPPLTPPMTCRGMEEHRRSHRHRNRFGNDRAVAPGSSTSRLAGRPCIVCLTGLARSVSLVGLLEGVSPPRLRYGSRHFPEGELTRATWVGRRDAKDSAGPC